MWLQESVIVGPLIQGSWSSLRIHLWPTSPQLQGNRCRHAHGNKELRSFRPEARMAVVQGLRCILRKIRNWESYKEIQREWDMKHNLRFNTFVAWWFWGLCRYAMLCHVMPCYAMLCHVMPPNTFWGWLWYIIIYHTLWESQWTNQRNDPIPRWPRRFRSRLSWLSANAVDLGDPLMVSNDKQW